jgi:hypothetical protein
MTGVFERARAETNGVVEHLRADNPNVPEELWTNFAARIADADTLASLYVPIYARHVTEQDVRDVVAFYRTPLGAHFLEVTPRIQEESRAAAKAWASDVSIDLLGSPDTSDAHEKSPPTSREPSSQLAPTRVAAIHELLRVSGTLTGAQQTMIGLLERLRQGPQAAAFPPSFWDEARKRLSNEADLLRLWTPAYAHHLTDAEIRRLIQFYHSPVGTRFIAALPAIQQESLTAGAQLGHAAAKRAVREVLGPLPQWRLQHPKAPVPEYTSETGQADGKPP